MERTFLGQRRSDSELVDDLELAEYDRLRLLERSCKLGEMFESCPEESIETATSLVCSVDHPSKHVISYNPSYTNSDSNIDHNQVNSVYLLPARRSSSKQATPKILSRNDPVLLNLPVPPILHLCSSLPLKSRTLHRPCHHPQINLSYSDPSLPARPRTIAKHLVARDRKS